MDHSFLGSCGDRNRGGSAPGGTAAAPVLHSLSRVAAERAVANEFHSRADTLPGGSAEWSDAVPQPACWDLASAHGPWGVRAPSLQSVRASSTGHCQKELSGAASPHTSLPTAASDGFFRRFLFLSAGCWKEVLRRPAAVLCRQPPCGQVSGLSGDRPAPCREEQVPDCNPRHDRSHALMCETQA